jgi:hypothetical protein
MAGYLHPHGLRLLYGPRLYQLQKVVAPVVEAPAVVAALPAPAAFRLCVRAAAADLALPGAASLLQDILTKALELSPAQVTINPPIADARVRTLLFAGGQSDAFDAVLVPALGDMLTDPAAKRRAWPDLKQLRSALATQ